MALQLRNVLGIWLALTACGGEQESGPATAGTWDGCGAAGGGGVPNEETGAGTGGNGDASSGAGAAGRAGGGTHDDGPPAGGDGGQGAGESVQCTIIGAHDTAVLLDAEHTVRAFPSATVSVVESPGLISMKGIMQSEARLELRFKGCFDASRVQSLVFTMSGHGGPVDVALDSPTNLRPPEGSCGGAYCYSPRLREFLEPPNLSVQGDWSDFTNGSPAATGDPDHVIGLTWTVKGEPGDAVDLAITQLAATTLP